jgi:Photosynthesis system II assembly factor YCF48
MRAAPRLIGAALALAALPAYAERWKIQSFYDGDRETFQVDDLAFPSAQRGIAVGRIVDDTGKKRTRFLSMITSDGGEHWTPRTLDESPRSVFFLNDSEGWMVTDDSIFHTMESGRSWKRVGWQINPNRKISKIEGGLIYRVAFVDEKHGFAVGAQKAFYETKNGGASWTTVVEGAQPAGNPAFTSYTHIIFDGSDGLVFGVSAPARQDNPRFPDWMEPERAIKRRQLPTLSILLKTVDKGATWKSETAPLFGTISSVRLKGDNGLAVFGFNQSFEWPSEVYRLDARTGKTERVYRDKLRVMDCALFDGPRAIIAGVEPQGKLNTPLIPGKITVLSTTNWTDWTPMDVDYKANARSVILAGPDATHQWMATDTGMILHLIP